MPSPMLLAFSFLLIVAKKAACSWSCPGTRGTSRRMGWSGPGPPWPLPRGELSGPGSRASPPRCLDYILEELKNNPKAEVMVASHNEDTVRFTLRR